MAQIQKADPLARKKAVGIILAGTVIGMAAIGAFEYYEADISSWLKSNIGWLASSPGTVFLIGLVVVAPLLIMSGYLFIYGRRVVEAERIPPPNYAVARDTKVKTGSQAVLVGRIVQLLSVFLMFAIAAIPIIFWHIFNRLSHFS